MAELKQVVSMDSLSSFERVIQFAREGARIRHRNCVMIHINPEEFKKLLHDATDEVRAFIDNTCEDGNHYMVNVGGFYEDQNGHASFVRIHFIIDSLYRRTVVHFLRSPLDHDQIVLYGGLTAGSIYNQTHIKRAIRYYNETSPSAKISRYFPS